MASRHCRKGLRCPVYFGHVAFGLANGRFEFRREFQIVLDHVVEPFPDLTKLRLRKFAQFDFHLLDFAHEAIMQSACEDCKKPRSGDLKSPTEETAIGKSPLLEAFLETAVCFGPRLLTVAP